ncbi:MAG: hypothetical protein LBC57_01880 [Treponema sp.]|jgi:hypothetical protein|nr:hypothetical protein [Treponema sp.]
MKRMVVLLPIVAAIFFACASEPQPQAVETITPAVQSEEASYEEEPDLEEVTEAPVLAPEFDPSTISEEVRETTKVDVQQYIANLNRIIKAKDYQGWVSSLGEKYFAEKSSKEYLAQVSQTARMKTQKIVLNTAQDYFLYVVVPSRANDRVDDIDFVSPNRVKAYTIDSKGRRLRIYDLEHTDNGWKIIN